ncbi:hypothetical protein KXW52_000524 [Aspergillus fumigatus]|nr:hypothetical protein KXW52_000524 [Aspergillus fumigatus]
MVQQREEPPQQLSPRLQARLDEQFEIRDRFIRQEFARVHERIDDLIKDNEARDKGIKREFRNVYERMDQMSQKMDQMSQKIDKLETSFTVFETTFANFKVAHLNQRIQAIPVYDSFHQPVPVPKCFPKTALRLYRLQDRKNWNHLKTLLKHYNLERAAIQLVDRGELYDSSDSDSDSDTSSRFHSIDRELDRAIESNPFAAISSFNRRKAQQKKGTVAKRPAEDAGSVRKMIRELVTGALQPGSFTRAQPLLDDDSEGKYTKLEWEVDSEKFKRETAHLRLRDTEVSPRPASAKDSPGSRQQRDLEVRSRQSKGSLSPTEKMTTSSNQSQGH